MPSAYIVWNTDNQIVEWNKAAEKIFGYSKEEVLGKNATEYIVPEKVRDLVGDVLKQLKAGEVTEYSERNNNIRKDGEFISCQWFNTPLADDNGNIFGFLTLAQDITHRVEAEEGREKLINELQEALENVKTLSGLLPICSHCKKIRDDKGYWNQIETYVHERSEATFSHGICQECAKEHYPDFNLYKE
jgi:PAS domain S-box-containing protein